MVEARTHEEVFRIAEDFMSGFVIRATQRVYHDRSWAPDGWVGLIDFKCWKFDLINMDGTPAMQTIGGDSSLDTTDDPDDAEVFVSGTIRWDGVTNLEIDRSIRFRGPSELRHFCNLFERLYAIARELIDGNTELLDWEAE